ncbi:MAG: DUF4367 domain-containing protein [Eubacterium sp.]|nr:DUF4367 domain-containing protein [Eubacterium sp.]
MSKSVKIQDGPKFKAFKENFEATMDAMEKDPEFAQMKLPEEWERDFKETMEATWEEERQRKKKRIGKRIAIAAGVTLVTLAGLNLGVQQVQGEGLVEFFQRTFNLNGKQYTTFDDETAEIMEDNDVKDIELNEATLSAVYEELQVIVKRPMLYITYVPEEYIVEEALYNTTYGVLNVTLNNSEDWIYIYEQEHYKEANTGVINKNDECIRVHNKNINEDVSIYQSAQDDYVSFSLKVENIFLAVRCNLPLDECEKIIESIKYY